VLIAATLLVAMIGGCTKQWAGADNDGNKIVLTDNQYKVLPLDQQVGFAEVSGFDDTVITQKIDPITGIATNILTVSSGLLPAPFNTIGMALLAVLGLWAKIKGVKIAKGSVLAAQAIEATKSLEDSSVWEDIMKPILSDGAIESTGLLKATMPDKL